MWRSSNSSIMQHLQQLKMRDQQEAPASNGELQVVGARVLILRSRATVRYIGPVSGQEGTWVGVEYDDPQRGKHDGMHAGVRYFATLGGPSAGSLVRLRQVNWGVSVLDALLARYHNRRGELGEVAQEELYVRTASQRRVHIQVVGVDKIQQQQSQTHRLASARLVGAGVSHVGDAEQLGAAAASLVELDLTGNLIADWERLVPPLCAALPTLQALNLSDNLLCLNPSTAPDASQGAGNAVPTAIWVPPAASILPGLKALVLNDCRVAWPQVVQLSRRLPNLEELHVSGNGISSLDAGSSGEPGLMCKLQVLSLDDNAMTDWGDVCQHLAPLAPELRVLNLSNNPLPALCTKPAAHSANGSSQPPFRHLSALFLADCQLSSWQDMDALHSQLPALRDTRLTGNPVLTSAKGGGRFQIIGRVAGLTMLNGSAVSSRERRDSEIRYLQTIVSGSVTDEASVLAAHPRYKELRAAYGDVLATAAGPAQGGSLGEGLLQLRLTCVAAEGGAKMGSHDKRLPRSMQLQSVQMLCEKLFKLGVGQQALFVKTPQDPLPQPLAHGSSTQSLAELGLQDGHELLVDVVAAA